MKIDDLDWHAAEVDVYLIEDDNDHQGMCVTVGVTTDGKPWVHVAEPRAGMTKVTRSVR